MYKYKQFYKKAGILKYSDILKKKIIDANSFEFPFNSVLHYVKNANVYSSPSTLDPFLNKRLNTSGGKTIVYNYFDYDTKNLKGKLVKRPITLNEIYKETIENESNFKVIRPMMKLSAIRERDLLIYNYCTLNYLYKYSLNVFNDFYKWYNPFKCIINNILTSPDNIKSKNHFILINIPDTLPNRLTLNTGTKGLSKKIIDKMKTRDYYNVLELWTYLFPKSRENSILNYIPNDLKSNITLLLSYNNNIVAINLSLLNNMIKDYEPIELSFLDNKVTSYDSKRVRDIIYLLVIYLVTLKENINFEEGDVDKVDKSSLEESIPDDNSLENILTNMGYSEDFETEEEEVSAVDEDDVPEVNKEDEIVEIDENDVGDTNVVISEDEQELMTINREYKDLDTLLNEKSFNYDENQEFFTYKLNLLKEENFITKGEYNSITKRISERGNEKTITGESLIETLNSDKDDYNLKDSETKVNDTVAVLDKKLNKNVINTITKDYINNQFEKDLVRCIYGVEKSNILIDNLEKVERENILGSLVEYSFNLKCYGGKANKITFFMPKINEDGTFKLSGNTYYMRKQRGDLPIRKISNIEVSLQSFYGKIFVNKATLTKYNVGYWFKKKLTAKYIEETRSGKSELSGVILFEIDNAGYKIPRDYGTVSRYVKSFTVNNITFYFDFEDRLKFLNAPEDIVNIEKENDLVLVGVNHTNSRFMFMDFQDRIFEYDGDKFVETKDIYNYVGLDRDDAPLEFTSLNLYNQRVPVVLLLCYYIGLSELLKLLKVQYKISDKKMVRVENGYYKLSFSDLTLIIKKDYGPNDLLLFGLKSMEKILSNLEHSILNSRSSFPIIFNKLELPISYVNEIRLLEDLFVDPITATVLKKMKEPQTFKGLLIRANEILVDDNYRNKNDIIEMYIKGYDRVAGMMYKEMVKAIKEHENRQFFGKSKVIIDPYSVLRKMNEDSTTVLIDDLNPIAQIKQTEDVSYTGEGGRSALGITKDNRKFHESEIGIISESTKDNSNVGVTAYMTAIPKIDNVRGMVGEIDIENDSWGNILSTPAMLMPFSTFDDTKRFK